MTEDRDDMAFWWPILQRSRVSAPRTVLLTTDVALSDLLDGKTPENFDGFLSALRAICDGMGYPCFLRTGQTSGKHDWRRTCYLKRGEDLVSHVAALVEFSEMADMLGLSTRTWAVREFLQLEHSFTAFDGMPVAREFRCFFEGGKSEPLCMHSYWPEDAIRNASVPDWKDRLVLINSCNPDDVSDIQETVRRVSPHFEGKWSLDVVRAKDGRFYVTDMAEMERSFHWQGCPNDPHPEHHRPELTDEERNVMASAWLVPETERR